MFVIGVPPYFVDRFCMKDVAQQRRTSGGGPIGADGNILASIDPTFNKADPGNVVLIKKTSLSEEPTPGKWDFISKIFRPDIKNQNEGFED